jgi:hypothetical protein
LSGVADAPARDIERLDKHEVSSMMRAGSAR